MAIFDKLKDEGVLKIADSNPDCPIIAISERCVKCSGIPIGKRIIGRYGNRTLNLTDAELEELRRPMTEEEIADLIGPTIAVLDQDRFRKLMGDDFSEVVAHYEAVREARSREICHKIPNPNKMTDKE